MERLLRFATERPGWTLALGGLLVVLALARIFGSVGPEGLTIDPSIDRLLPEDDPHRAFYDHVRRLFGSDETLVVALVADDVFSAENLRRVKRIAGRLETLDGVQRVVSLHNALNIRSVDGDLLIEPFIDTVPDDPAALAAIRREVLANPIYAGGLVSPDARAAAILVYLQNIPERELIERGVDLAIARIAREERGDAEAWVTGGTVIKAETSRMLLADLRTTLPIVVGLVVAVAFAAFRSAVGLLVPVATALAALAWTLGAVALTGASLNLVTAVVPSLLLVVGFAYAIHIVSEYQDALRESPDAASASPVSEALRGVALPVALTGLTTAAGLLSLALSPIAAIREFGVIATVGVAFAVVASLTLAPALLVVLPRPKPYREGIGRFAAFADRLARFDVRHRTAILVGGAVLAGVSLWAIPRIVVSNDFVRDFPEESAIRRNIDAVNRNLGGSNTFYVVIETDYRDAFVEPVNLREVEQLQDWLEAQPEIGGSTSLVDYLKLIHRGFHDNDPAMERVPDSRRLAKQLFFFAGNDELRSFVDSRYQTANISVRTRVNDSGAMAALVARIEERVAELPDQLSATVTGNSVVVTRTLDDIARGQATSLAAAFFAIFVILALLFTSLRVGFLALIPNAIPVLAYFGILGLSGVTLNTTTGLVACIVLGIAVDDTIHFLARFNAAARRRLDETEGVAEALRAVGRPVTVTTAALCLGFLALTASQLRNQVEFGALAAATLAVAWLVDVTFTPALAARMRIVTLWDALTLDLGRDPQKSIPLFEGLRSTQARVAALMTSVRSFPKGHQVFRAGDPGGEMFVVIEGVLQASRATRDGVVSFGEMLRGDTVGEVALFHGTRTADVHALSDVRVLRLTHENLERLRRRYPRTGARIYANLSRILANRVATTTEALR